MQLRYCSSSLDRKFGSNFACFSCPFTAHKIKKIIKIAPFYGLHLLWTKKVSLLLVNCASSKDPGLLKHQLSLSFDQVDSLRTDESVSKDVNLACPEICSQIEKLVFFKRYEEAFKLFETLPSSDRLLASTYDSLVSACIILASNRASKKVRKVYRHMIDSGFEFDQYMSNRVLSMHLKCGMKVHARKLFVDMPQRDIATWNIMISGLMRTGAYEEALDLFLIMWEELYDIVDAQMFATMVCASASSGCILAGRQLHSCVVKLAFSENVILSCALIDMYGKCGDIEEAQSIFDKMPEKTTVAWNSLIAGYAVHGESEKALDLYYDMRRSNVKMDHFTYATIIKVCARLGSLEHAKQAHAGLVRDGFGFDLVANSALVNFYSKWGKIEDARNIFDRMPRKNVICWNALIHGYGNHGLGNEAVRMFERMMKERMTPNHVTFLAVLGACCNSGLLDKGKEIFAMMGQDPKAIPGAMHYACMVELFGREGLLNEAYAMIKNAPFNPTMGMWAALLTSSRIHKNLELGKLAAEKLFALDPKKISNYHVLLNIYNSSGRLAETAKVLETLKKNGLMIHPVCSWIEIRKQTYMFCFGDKPHPNNDQIYQMVDSLMDEIVKCGYVPQKEHILPDVGEHEQMVSVYHSEKLAIAYGLINTPDSTALQIVQDHRICNDCHNVIKLITLVTKRKITVRDAGRFHHFRHGKCSCGDFW